MMRPPFVGHRRYSITHRAVQRLRELLRSPSDQDDEALRDKLDEALGAAEDGGRAVRTLDAMLGEPQTLIPVDAFGDLLYAIVKEDTVVTVLPRGHGEEILHRGQAMEQRVAAGQANVRAEPARRRWQKEVATRPAPGGAGAPAPVVVEHIGRPAASHSASETAPGLLVKLPRRPSVEGPVATALHRALEQGRRRAAVLAIRDVVATEDRSAALLPLWNALAHHRLAQSLTLGDLIEAVRAAPPALSQPAG